VSDTEREASCGTARTPDRVELEIRRDRGRYIITGHDSLNVPATLHCGQAFRWRRVGDVEEAVVRGRLLRFRQYGEALIVGPPSDEQTVSLAIRYLGLDEAHKPREEALARIDPVMEAAVEHSRGLRLLNQEPWECLISYILSARNSIPLISRVIENICCEWGTPVEFEGQVFHAFPDPADLSCAGEEDIVACRAGFRSRSVCEATARVSSGETDLDAIARLDYHRAKEALMRLRGVGEKVADCVLLFSMGKHEAFPVDVWIQRAVRYLYFDGRDISPAEIRVWAAEKFGPLAGYAQEYLFAYAREVIPNALRG
jgi:N-glycosylase/DNA lyase